MSICLTVIFLFLKTMRPDASEEWIFKKEVDGIKVWYKKDPDAGIYSFKSVSTVECGLAGVVQLFLETENYPKWVYRCATTKLLRRDAQTDFFYYILYDFPWPLSDRDCVLHSKMWQDPNSKAVIVETESAPNETPVRQGVVRLQAVKTHWTFCPLGRARTQLTHIVQVDPGGAIPDWASNIGTDEGMIKNDQAIRRCLSATVYQNAQLDFIKE